MKKQLRILLGNGTLSLLAGSETWTKTLALQLKKLGHDVEVYSPDLGWASEELEKNDIKCHDNLAANGIAPFSYVLEEEKNFNFDVIIANHNHIIDYLRSQFPKTPIIATIHGILHLIKDKKTGNEIMAPEYPSLNAGVNEFIAVSDEVKKKLQDDYSIESQMIMNSFDMQEFKAKRPITKDKPKMILFNTNYFCNTDPEFVVMKKVAKHYGAKLAAIGQNFVVTKNVMQGIEDSDIVVGMGRSVLEGVSAGRLGIVHGRWGTGGIVCEKNIDELRFYNFSGRNSNDQYYTEQQFIDVIDEYYNQKTIDWGINYIKREHNIVSVADQYLRIARSLLGEDIKKEDEVPLKPYRRAKDVATKNSQN